MDDCGRSTVPTRATRKLIKTSSALFSIVSRFFTVGYWNRRVGCYGKADGRRLKLFGLTSLAMTSAIFRPSAPFWIILPSHALIYCEGKIDLPSESVSVSMSCNNCPVSMCWCIMRVKSSRTWDLMTSKRCWLVHCPPFHSFYVFIWYQNTWMRMVESRRFFSL